MSITKEIISELKKALSEYGSDIKLRRVTAGVYDPMTGDSTDTIVSVDTKSFIGKQATETTQRAFNEDYEIAFMMYLDFVPNKTDKVIFNGDEYNIVYIAPTTLMNINVKYEILAKK